MVAWPENLKKEESIMASKQLLSSKPIQWAAGGWSLFLAENFILSENRTYIISSIGDDNYHYLYGFCSTAAVGSILYGYTHVKNAAPCIPGGVSTVARMGSLGLLSLGLGMMSQSAPKLQIPVQLVRTDDADSSANVQSPLSSSSSTATAASTQPQRSFQVRCPFDFTDNPSKLQIQHINGQTITLSGIDRISRHPGLWSFGFIGCGLGLLSPSIPTRIFTSMPLLIAWLGGAHTDSRFRRGMGGTLSKEMDEVTSHVPFVAMMSGRQGDVGQVWSDLAGKELKGLNAFLSFGLAAGIVTLNRGRGVGSVVQNRRLINEALSR